MLLADAPAPAQAAPQSGVQVAGLLDLFKLMALIGDVPTPKAAADIRQVVNVILWRKREKFQPGTSFKSWAFRIAQLEVKTHLRKQRKDRSMQFDPEMIECFAEELPEVLDELPERRAALAVCLKNLTRKDDELIRHRYWSGGSLERLAQEDQRLHEVRQAALGWEAEQLLGRKRRRGADRSAAEQLWQEAQPKGRRVEWRWPVSS